MANNGRFEYTIGFKTDESGLKKAKEELEKIQQLTINSSELKIDLKPGEAEIYAANIQNAKDSALQLYNALQNATKANGQFSATSFIGQLKTLNLKEIYDNMAKLGPVGTQAFRSMADQALKLNTYVKQSNTILTKFGNTLYRNLEWLVSGNLINTVTGVFTKAYGFTKNLDSSLNDIRIVTGKSADEMERFGREAQQTALELSKGTTDITNASLIFYQQGLDQEEVNARTEVTAKMSNVTGQSAETIADQMTAVWNGFKVGSEELEHYADVMTAVAASTASSSAELAGAISKVSSIAHTTGVDMEQLSAMISTVISVTRDSPETVGTAFKTIFARMDDLVEDGTDEFGVTLGRVSSHLAAMGIEILDEDGKLRDFGDTLTETGEKWSSYSREQQVAIAEQMGGKRQWNQVLALFDNWDKYSDALDVARNSTGALQEQQDIYSERVEAHLQQLKTQWEGVYQELLNSKEILAVVDAGKNLLSVLETIVKTAGGAVPILGSVASIMLGAFSDKVAQQIMRIKNNLILMAEAASDAALKTKVAKEFGAAANPNDKAFQAQIAYYKAAGQMTATMTEEERKRINALGEASSQKAKEVQELVEEKKILDEVAKKWGNIKEYQDTSSINVEELKEKIQQVKKEAQEAAQAFENWRTNEDFTVETLTGSQTPDLTMSSSKSKTYAPESGKVAFKPTGSGGISKEEQQALKEANSAAEKYQQALDSLKEKQNQYNKAVQNGETDLGGYLQQLAGAQDGYRLATEELQKASQGLEQFDNLTEESKQNLQSINSINLSDSFDGFDQLNEKFQELQTQGLLSEKSIEEISAKLKTIDRTDTLQLADAWDLLNQKLQESKQDFKKLSDGTLNQTIEKLKQARSEAISLSQQKIQSLEEAQFSKATQGLTQMTSAVGQLGFGLQSLSNAWKTLNNDEATGLEKFTAMTMAITQVGHATKTAISGLDNFLSAILLDNKAIDENVRIENEAIRQSAESQALKMAEAEQNERNAAIIGVENAEKEINNNETEEEIINGTINNGLKTTETNERGTNTVAIAAETDAQTVQNGVNAVARTGQALTLANLKAIIAARLAHVKALAKEALAMAAAHPVKTGIVIAIAAVIGAIIAWINVLKKKRKEEQEHLKLNKELIQSNNEIIESNKKNLQSYNDYKQVWNDFHNGTIAVDEYKEKLLSTIEALGLSEDPMIQHSILVADQTGDYEQLNEQIRERINLQKQEALLLTKTNIEKGQETEGKDFSEAHSGREDLGYLAPVAGDYETSAAKGAAIWKRETADGVDMNVVSTANGHFSIDWGSALKGLSPEEISDRMSQWEIYLEDILAKAIENGDAERQTQIAKQLDDVRKYQQGVRESVNDFIQDTFDTTVISTTDEAKLATEEKASELIDDYVGQLKEEYEKQGKGYLFNEDEARSYIEQQLIASFPSSREIISKAAASKDAYKNAYNQINDVVKNEIKTNTGTLKIAWEQYEKEIIPEENLAKLKKKFEENNLDFSSINWNLLTPETYGELLNGKIDNAFNILSQSAQQLREPLQYLTQDYNSLSSAYEGFDSKVKKGTFDVKTFNSKAFQEFFTDDVKNELIEVYGATSDVGEAIKTLSNEAIVGSEEWKQAWEVFGTALDNAEITQDIQNAQNALDQISNHIKQIPKEDIHILAGVSVEEAEEEIDNFVNAQRTIDIDISVKAESKTDAIKDTLKDVQELGSKIDENLQLSFEDFIELEQQFPKIGEDMQILADGTIQLSQTAVDEARKQQKENIAIAVDEQIAKIEIEKTLLEEKKKKYEEAAEEAKKFAQKAANGQYKEEDQLQSDLNVLQEYYNDIQDISDRQERAEELQLQKDQVEDWKKYYDSVLELDAEYNKERIRNANSVTEEEVKDKIDTENTPKATSFYKLTSGDIWNRTESQFTTMTYSELAAAAAANKKKPKLNNTAIEEYWNGVYDSMTQGADDVQKSLDTMSGTEDRLNRIKQMYSNQTSLWGKKTDATKENTDATKENAEVQQEMIDLLNEEIDAYHDVNVEIERNTTALNRLQKAQEKLTGKDLIKNYQEQIKQLDKLNGSFQEKQRLQYEEAAGYRVILEGEGVTFNDDGTIANYGARLNQKLKEIQDDQIWYNSLSGEEQEGYKDWIKERQQEYDSLTEFIEKYENLWNKEIPNLEDEISDNLDQQLELTLTITKTEYQIKLDKGEIKRAEIELQKEIQHLQDSDVLGNVIIDIKTLLTFDETEEGKQLKENFEKIKEQYEYYINNNMDPPKQIEEAYKEVLESWTKYVSERTQQIEDIVTKSFDRLSKKLDRQKIQFETIDKIFEHDINLVKLKYGENAYQQLETLYKARERVSKAQLENANLQVEVFQNALKEAQENGLGQDVINDLEDKLAESYETQRQMLEDHLNFLKEQSNQAIDEIFDHLNEQMAGVSLEDMKNQWDWINRDSDDYYDTINAAYELEKLRTQMKKAINETDDVSTQQALNDLMNNELANLQQKDKLSKYDLERANALFDIEQKRAAFREAQNNKSKMRLRRDSSGNYSYQFVSDEDKVTTAMQDLADAQNQLYNIDKEAYKNNLDKLYEYYVEYQEKLKEANNDEERAQITQNYLTKIVELQGEHLDIIDALQQTAAEKTGKRFEEMAQAEKDILMGDLIPAWSSTWATMIRDPNFEKFLAITGAEASDIAAEFELKSDAAIQDITGTTLEDIANGIDPAVEAIDSMVESTKNLSTELYDLLAILSTLPSAFDNNVESIDSLIATAKDRYNNLMAERVSTKDSINKAKMTDKSIREIDLAVPKEPIEIDKTLDNTSILTKTLKIISDKIDKFYTDQMSLLKLESTKSSLNSVYNTNVNSSTPTLEAPIYIDANFPAVNSAQEIKDALNMLVNQATQKAFNTLR